MPRNLRQVLTRGLEASSQLTWQRPAWRLTTQLGYAFTQARKARGYSRDPDPAGLQLAYVPLHATSLSSALSWRQWQLSAASSFTGYRYVTASATDYLPGYLLLQAGLSRQFQVGRLRLTALLQGFNLTNARYQTYAERAMPPRSAMVSLRLAWH